MDQPSGSVRITVLIPAYNERGGIGTVLEEVRECLSRSGGPFEILVVDDGSSDDTGAAALEAGVRVLRHTANRGYGAALKTGMRHAEGDIIVITDADATYPAEAIPQIAARVADGTADMVVASRTGEKVSIPLLRRPAKWVIRKLAELVAGQPIPDLNSGLRAFRRSTASRFVSILPDGFSFTTTITLGMITNGFIVGYHPIDYMPRVGRSKIRPVRDTLNFVNLVLRIALYFEPLKIFIPLAAILAVGALGWALFTKLALGQLADVTTIVVFMTAVQVAVVGLLAELVVRRLPNEYRNSHAAPEAHGLVGPEDTT